MSWMYTQVGWDSGEYMSKSSITYFWQFQVTINPFQQIHFPTRDTPYHEPRGISNMVRLTARIHVNYVRRSIAIL